MNLDVVKNAQRVLRARAGYAGAIDGDAGRKSLAAAWRVGAGDPDKGWSAERIVVEAAQIVLAAEGFEPGPLDGLWGVRTDGAFLEWRAAGLGVDFVDRAAEDDFGRQRDMAERFGPAGGHDCTAGRVVVPWRMFLAWDQGQQIREIRCHKKVAGSAQRAFTRIAQRYSPEEIRALGLDQFGGCYNFRKMRGADVLSTHAYGVALDFDPLRNRLTWGRDQARLAQPDAGGFFDAWEAEGWTSLGRAKNFDWMHVQAPGV